MVEKHQRSLVSGQWVIPFVPLDAEMFARWTRHPSFDFTKNIPRDPRAFFRKGPLWWLRSSGIGIVRWIALIEMIEAAAAVEVRPWLKYPEAHTALRGFADGPFAKAWRWGSLSLQEYEAQLREIAPVCVTPAKALKQALTEQLTGPAIELLSRLPAAAARVEALGPADELIEACIACVGGNGRGGDSRFVQILRRRMGLEGSANATLQAIGDQFSLTRQRIDQMLRKFRTRLPLHRPYLPRTEAAIAQFLEYLPASDEQIESHAPFHQLLGQGADMHSFVRFAAEFFGFEVPIDRMPGLVPLVVRNGQDPLVAAIQAVALRQLNNSGVVHADVVAGEACERIGASIGPGLVARVLTSRIGMKAIPTPYQRAPWYWEGPMLSNRLVRTILKILVSAPGRVDVTEIASGVLRNSRPGAPSDNDRGIGVTPRLVLEVGRQIPGVEISQFDDLYLADRGAYPIEAVLSGSESQIRSALLSLDGVAAYSEITQLVVARAALMSREMVQVTLMSSPIFERLRWGVYCLRGVPVSPAALARALATLPPHLNGVSVATKQPERGVRDFAVEPDGSMWISLLLADEEKNFLHLPQEVGQAVVPAMRVRHAGAEVIMPLQTWQAGAGPIYRMTNLEGLRALVPSIDAGPVLLTRAAPDAAFEVSSSA